MSGTKVVTCGCKNEYQDRVYGAGKRVANKVATSANQPPAYRCTVCGAVDGKKK